VTFLRRQRLEGDGRRRQTAWRARDGMRRLLRWKAVATSPASNACAAARLRTSACLSCTCLSLLSLSLLAGGVGVGRI